MPELLLVSTQAAFDLRDLRRSVERHLPPGASVRTAPGLLTPEGEDDLPVLAGARDRGSVIVVVAPGGPDLVNHVLLTAAEARAAGLAVPAVVVAGPGGQDQRAALEAGAACPVFALADPQAPSAEVAGWPLADWLLADPIAADGAAVALAPYAVWLGAEVPDPRAAVRPIIDGALLDIVATEGPILAGRAYRLYTRAAGGRSLTSVARAPLSSSAFRLRQDGSIAFATPQGAAPGGDDDVLHLVDTPVVRVRELGPRALDEVPLGELAELMRRLAAAGTPPDDLPRAVLDTYGLVRMTAKAEALLGAARELAGAADAAQREA